MSGLARLGSLAVSRPRQAEVITTLTGLRLAFHYPTQLMPLLVVFQELMDPELAILGGLLGPGRVAIDVGASIGTWTLCAAKTGAVVHAFEPDAENFTVLNENVRDNGLAANVTTHNVAFGAGEGWSRIAHGNRRYLTTVRSTLNAAESTGTRIQTLDQFIRKAGITRVDALKINTAGCEADVLAGAMDLFRQERVGTAILLDGLALRGVLDELTGRSYQLGFYDSRKRRFIAVGDSSELDDARPGPMNRHVLVKHASITV
jgi:FkbM family methyltransferase